jgi:hypothetical protein
MLGARHEQDWVDACVFYLVEIEGKGHPKAHELGRDLQFYLQLVFGDPNRIWRKAEKIVSLC